MADEVNPIDKSPDALANRQRVVQLSDDSTVVVPKWSREKYGVLLPFMADIDKIPVVAEQSVGEADREKVRGMEFGDQMAIANAAFDLNVTESVLKNLPAYMKNNARFVEAATKSVSRKNPS